MKRRRGALVRHAPPGAWRDEWTLIPRTGAGRQPRSSKINQERRCIRGVCGNGRVLDLSFANSSQYASVDCPELDPEFPTELPFEGQATCAGQAGGQYACVPGSGCGEHEGACVLESASRKASHCYDGCNATRQCFEPSGARALLTVRPSRSSSPNLPRCNRSLVWPPHPSGYPCSNRDHPLPSIASHGSHRRFRVFKP